MEKEKPSLSLVVLAFNDAASLPALVSGLHGRLSELCADFDLLIVDDGSADGTAAVAQGLAASYPGTKLLRHERNLGVGAAFRTGADAARFGVVGYIDGDGQYDPDDLGAMLKGLEGADAVASFRPRRADPAHRRLISLLYNRLLGLLFGLPFEDANSGFKLYRRAFLEACPIASDGAFYDAELLIKGMAAGMRIRVVPVRHLPRRHGKGLGASPGSIRGALRSLAAPGLKPYLRPSFAARALWRLLRLIFA